MERVHPYLEVGGQIGWLGTRAETTTDGETISESSHDILSTYAGGVGIDMPLGDRVEFDLFGGYTSNVLKPHDATPLHQKTVMNTGLLKLGFSVFLN
jgi:hypothetical protein